MTSLRQVRGVDSPITRLALDLEATSSFIEGNHLSEEQMVAYSIGVIPDTDRRRLDLHLATCSKCVDELEHLIEIDEFLEVSSMNTRLSSISNQALVTTKKKISWKGFFKLAAAANVFLILLLILNPLAPTDTKQVNSVVESQMADRSSVELFLDCFLVGFANSEGVWQVDDSPP